MGSADRTEATTRADRPGVVGQEIPAPLRRLWEEPAPPRRGPRPALSLARIAQAAIDLADAEGLGAVSMARVAEALGYSPMALYRYVDSKDELLVLMADAAAGPPPDLRVGATGWRDQMERWTRAQIEMVLARPWFIELPLASAQPGPNRVLWLDHAFDALRDVDISVDDKFQIIGLLAQHVLGEARVQVETRRVAAERVRREAGLPADAPEADLDPEALKAANPYADFEAVLVHYADPARYPALFRALADAQPGEVPGTPSDGEPAPGIDDLGWSVAIVLDGVAAFIERRQRERRAPAPPRARSGGPGADL